MQSETQDSPVRRGLMVGFLVALILGIGLVVWAADEAGSTGLACEHQYAKTDHAGQLYIEDDQPVLRWAEDQGEWFPHEVHAGYRWTRTEQARGECTPPTTTTPSTTVPPDTTTTTVVPPTTVPPETPSTLPEPELDPCLCLAVNGGCDHLGVECQPDPCELATVDPECADHEQAPPLPSPEPNPEPERTVLPNTGASQAFTLFAIGGVLGLVGSRLVRLASTKAHR